MVPQQAIAAKSKAARAHVSAAVHQRRKTRLAANARIKRLAIATVTRTKARAARKVRNAATVATNQSFVTRRQRVRLSRKPASQKVAFRAGRSRAAFVDGRDLSERSQTSFEPENGVRTSNGRSPLLNNGQRRRKKGAGNRVAALAPRSGRHTFDAWCTRLDRPAIGLQFEGAPDFNWMRARRGRN
jgi:hypothetical protein